MTTTVHVISHTHWDREWYLTFEQYRARLVDLVDAVLDRMERDPRFTYFHLDGQSVVLEDYLEIRPEREPDIRRRVQEGRLLVGPWYVMPDMFLVSGESLVRNLSLGIRIAGGFGRTMRVGYIPDPFGHVSQMPQLLAGMGLEGAILWRGFGGRGAEYRWVSPDGTDVLLSHLPPDGYCNGLRLPLVSGDELRRQTVAVLDHEKSRSTSGQVLLMVGVDHVEPHPTLLDLVDLIDGLPGTRASLSTLPAFVDAVRSRVSKETLETITGELRGGQDYAHLLPGVFSARTYLKQANARAQRELEQWAEPLAAGAALAAAGQIGRGAYRYAWRTLLQNHPHDSICGCSIDAVHDENMTRFAKVLEVTEDAARKAARTIAAALPPAPAGVFRSVALNTSMWRWTGVFETAIDIPLEPAPGFPSVDFTVLDEPLTFFGPDAAIANVTDAGGRPVRYQVLGSEETISFRMSRFAPPPGVRVRRVRLAIEADVAPFGWRALDFHIGAPAPAAVATAGQEHAIENDRVRVRFADGAFEVEDRQSRTVYGPIFLLEDVGDVGDEYNYAPPAADTRITSRDARDVHVRVVEQGPLLWAIEATGVLDLPAAAAADRQSRSDERVPLRFTLRASIRAGSSAVACEAVVDNQARDHRLRVLCATGAARVGTHRADSAFDVATRPATAAALPGPLAEQPVGTAPMQSFADAGDEQAGATLVADGLPEFEVVHHAAGADLALTLLRCVGDLSRNDLSTRRGHAGPGLATPGAQCIGTHHFRFTWVPRAAPPPAERLYATARAALMPPRVIAPAGGSGALETDGSFLPFEVSGSTAPVVSACKLADDRQSVIVRLFNPSDTPANAALRLPASVAAVHRTDLAETRGPACSTDGRRVTFDVGPRKIATFELMLKERHA